MRAKQDAPCAVGGQCADDVFGREATAVVGGDLRLLHGDGSAVAPQLVGQIGGAGTMRLCAGHAWPKVHLSGYVGQGTVGVEVGRRSRCPGGSRRFALRRRLDLSSASGGQE